MDFDYDRASMEILYKEEVVGLVQRVIGEFQDSMLTCFIDYVRISKQVA